jgi:hypothetical protein
VQKIGPTGSFERFLSVKRCNSENGTGRHGTSIQSGLTKLSHFLICWRYASGQHVYEITLAYMGPEKPMAAQKAKKECSVEFSAYCNAVGFVFMCVSRLLKEFSN